MDLNDLLVFVKVVEQGSFSKAGQELGMPNSTVSHKVSSLEQRLGVTLIKRTTRKLIVTPIGMNYFQEAQKAINLILNTEKEIFQQKDEPEGILRITAPPELGNVILPDIIARFMKKFPKVRIDVVYTDRVLNLLEDQIDLAIRAGDLKDSSLKARKLGHNTFALFASPKYLKESTPIKTPKDLCNHQCIQFLPFGRDEWKLKSIQGVTTIKLKGDFIYTDLNMVKGLALNHLGIAALPTFVCVEEVKQKKLVKILGEWNSSFVPVHFVYPAEKFVPKKLSEFINFAADDIKKKLESHLLI